MGTQAVKYVDLKIEKEKIDKAKKYFNVRSNSQVLKKMFDWFEYSQDVNDTMKEIGGRGKIKKIYE